MHPPPLPQVFSYFNCPRRMMRLLGLKCGTISFKVTYILSQLSTSQRPPDEMLSQWAYGSLKKHNLTRGVIDRYLKVPAFRTIENLWEGVELALKESQYDTNAHSIRDDLRKGPTASPKQCQLLPKGKAQVPKVLLKETRIPKERSSGKNSTEGTPPPCTVFACGNAPGLIVHLPISMLQL